MSDISSNPSTIGIIVSRDLVGDALVKLPFLRALRAAFPQAEIHWISSHGPTAFARELRVPTAAFIDKLHEEPPWLATSAKPNVSIPAPRFDLLIDTRDRWREATYAREIPHGLFVAPALHYLLSEKRPPLFSRRPPHVCDRLIETIMIAANKATHSMTGALPVPDEVMQRAREIFPAGRVYVGLAPGSGSRVKAWPRYKFEKVAMTQAQKGRVPVFILGPQELNWYDELQSTVPAAKFPLQNYDLWGSFQITLDHTLALGRLLDVAVVNDSGVGHMLAAADCPLISLFGPTDPAKLAPRSSRVKIIRAQDFGAPHMREITWETVNEAIDEMLGAR